MAVAHGEEMGTGVGVLHKHHRPQPLAAAREGLPEDVAAAAIARGTGGPARAADRSSPRARLGAAATP